MPKPIDYTKTLEMLYGKPKDRVATDRIATELAGLTQSEKDASQIGCCGSYCSEAGCCPYPPDPFGNVKIRLRND